MPECGEDGSDNDAVTECIVTGQPLCESCARVGDAILRGGG